MKMILCLFLVIACISLGIIFSNNLKRKKIFWDEIVKFCEMLSTNIGFGQKKIKEIILDYQQICHGDCKQLLINFANNDQCKDIFFEVSNNLLDDEERGILIEFFQTLGELDVYNELIKIENYKVRFFKKYNNYYEKSDKFCPLIFKLSVVFGIGLFIVFI